MKPVMVKGLGLTRDYSKGGKRRGVPARTLPFALLLIGFIPQLEPANYAFAEC
jgi:hypothetical protein